MRVLTLCAKVLLIIATYFVLVRIFQKSTSNLPETFMPIALIDYRKNFYEAVRQLQAKAVESLRVCMYEFELNSFLYHLEQRFHLSDSDEYRLYRPYAPLERLDVDSLVVLVMGSSTNANRSRLAARTWLRFVKHYFIFADEKIAGVSNVVVFDWQHGKTAWHDAQHRQLRGAQWLRSRRPKLVERAKWFLFADDDSWVNVPALLNLLLKYNEELPLAFGFIWDNTFEEHICTLSGGAGMILSRRAFRDVAANLYRARCPFMKLNDLTLTHCFFSLRVMKVYAEGLSPATLQWFSYNNDTVLYPPTYVSRMSFHYMRWVIIAERITCDVVAFWKFTGANRGDLAEECKNFKRFSPFLQFDMDTEFELV